MRVWYGVYMETNTETNTAAKIIDVGKRKFIPALHVTLPDGTVEQSKGNRAVKAAVVAIRQNRETGDYFHTSHARRDLALSWDPLGKGQDTVDKLWKLIEVLPVERPEVAE